MEKKKHKLIIIDDEYVVIKGLRETIDWKAMDIEIIADCKNGAAGLEAIHKFKPDLVISDIRMPKMDGLQLAKILSEENFDGAVIIYSGYSDFEYARKAIDFGVTKYILKPIENEVLISNIKEALLNLEAERDKRKALKQYAMGLPLLRENLIEQILNGRNTGEALEKLNLIGVALPVSGIVIECALLEAGEDDSSFYALYDELLDSMKGFSVVGQKYNERFVILTGLTEASVIYNRVNEILQHSASLSRCRVSVGISNAYGTKQTLQDSYKQAKRLREDYLFTNINNVKTEDESENKQRKKVIDDALKIISADYGQKLLIKEIAEKLYVSESHLMHEFKENLGKTFIECLTEYRMLKAKELLGEGRLRVNEVADKVGYSDVRYFRQIFKETVGMSPSEYVEKLKKE